MTRKLTLRQSSKLRPPIPGTTEVIETSTLHLRRSLVSSCHSPLLLTGGKGSGKTSIAKHIGSRLESDVNILAEMIYEDVARLDDQTRLKDIKARMTGWLDKAKKRTPCLLILDKLDVLLSPESEVGFSPILVRAPWN